MAMLRVRHRLSNHSFTESVSHSVSKCLTLTVLGLHCTVSTATSRSLVGAEQTTAVNFEFDQPWSKPISKLKQMVVCLIQALYILVFDLSFA